MYEFPKWLLDLHRLEVEIDGHEDPRPILDSLLGSHEKVSEWLQVDHRWVKKDDHPLGWQRFTFLPLRYRTEVS